MAVSHRVHKLVLVTPDVELKGARALVTGGAGFVGSHIVEQLIEAGAAHVAVVDDFTRGRLENLRSVSGSAALEVIEGDICEASVIDRASVGSDYIFHQAALRITQCAEDPVRAVKVMIEGTQNVLESAVRHGVAKVLVASSASVYGEPAVLPMRESDAFNNRTIYGAAKIANEQMSRAYAEMYGLRYLALRPFNVYGPRMDAFGVYTEVMIRWLERLGRGEAPLIFGDGAQTMDFVYAGDVARAYLLAATSDATDDVLNVGSGTETSLTELCYLLCEAAGHPNLVPIYAEARKVNGVTRRRASTEHARDSIGFEAQVGLREGLQELVSWYHSLTPLPSLAVG
jgi:UDP-glucose 4-epimerase